MATTVKRYYRVDRRQIVYVRSILEGYDHLAVLTTLDRAQGRVVVSVAPGCESQVLAIMEELGQTIMLQPLSEAAVRISAQED